VRRLTYLPRNVGFPAAPRLGQVLQNRTGLVLLDTLRHHVHDVVHHRGPELEVEVALDSLLRHGLGHPLGVAPLELAREQVAQPALQQRRDAPHEEEPHTPAGRPEAAPRSLAHRALEADRGTKPNQTQAHTTGQATSRKRLSHRVESVVDEMFEILAHPDLPHELVLVSVHAGELAHVGEHVLEAVGELEGVHVVQTVLHVRVDDQLRQTKDFSAKMERCDKDIQLTYISFTLLLHFTFLLFKLDAHVKHQAI